MELVFWLSAAFIAYVYAGYPALLGVWAALSAKSDDGGRRRPGLRDIEAWPGVSIIIAARNEGPRLPARIDNLLASDYPAKRMQIIVASDGSTDDTAERLAPYCGPRAEASGRAGVVELIAMPPSGKAAALNAAVVRARYPILVFADARQRFAPDAIRRLVSHFRDAQVGAVSGELVLDCECPGDRARDDRPRDDGSSTIGDGLSLYWKYEKWLRRREAVVGSTLGVTGAIYAMRRWLWQPLPADTLLDDVLGPMRVVLRGYRVTFDAGARAFDVAARDAAAELRRKVRTLAGNFQLLAREPRLLVPGVNPVWLQFMSHKVGRLLVPYALVTLCVTSTALATSSWLYAAAFGAQMTFYALAAYGAVLDRRRQAAPIARDEVFHEAACARRPRGDGLRRAELRGGRRSLSGRARPAGVAMSVRERLTFGHGLHVPVPSRKAVIATAATLAHEPQPVRFSRLETWDWGWGGLLIFSVLLFFRPQDQIAALGALHISDAAAIVGLVAMVILNTSRREPVTRITPELLGVMGLGAVILLTVPFSFWPTGSITVFTDVFIQVTLIFMLMVNTITSPRRVERICWVIVLAFGYISARVIFDYMRGVNLVEGHRASGPVGGFFENPNDLALNLAAFLPLAMMYVKRPGPALKRLFCAGICVLMLLALFFTKSRSGQLGALAMLVTYLLVSRSLKPANILALVVGGMIVLPMLPQSYWDRMASIFDEEKDETGSREERRLLMQQAWDVFVENPFTGIGAGQFQNYSEPGKAKRWRETHNALLEVASELGIFGVAAFCFLIWRAFRGAWWTRRELSWIYQRRTRKRVALPEPEDGLTEHERAFLQTHGAAMIACLAGWFVSALFASVAFNWTFYYLLGLAVTPEAIVRARARAYAKAKALAAREMAAA